MTKLTAPEFTDVSGTLDIVIYAALACFAVELLGLFSGLTMFKPGLSLLYIVAHFCGCVFTAFLTMETWCVRLRLLDFVLRCAAVRCDARCAAHAAANAADANAPAAGRHYAWFYYIFGACSAFPAGLEVLTMLAIATKKHT